MSNSQFQTCETAVKILRDCPYDNPYRVIRLKYADQIELQSLVGNPEYDDACVSLSLSIINAAQQGRAADGLESVGVSPVVKNDGTSEEDSSPSSARR